MVSISALLSFGSGCSPISVLIHLFQVLVKLKHVLSIRLSMQIHENSSRLTYLRKRTSFSIGNCNTSTRRDTPHAKQDLIRPTDAELLFKLMLHMPPPRTTSTTGQAPEWLYLAASRRASDERQPHLRVVEIMAEQACCDDRVLCSFAHDNPQEARYLQPRELCRAHFLLIYLGSKHSQSTV